MDAQRIEPDLEVVRELREFGGESFKRCSQCATCSVVCELSSGDGDFPRKKMLWAQWGLGDRLIGSLDPWLCYYCGKCSERCPREAEPGETLMALRRWLTSRYDFTGLSRLFYRSWKAELGVVLLVALATGFGFFTYGMSHGNLAAYDGPEAFLPSDVVHVFDWAMAGVLTTLLAINAIRMWWFTVGRDRSLRIPLSSYAKRLYMVPMHFFTQKRFAGCDARPPWVVHLVLMLSYVTLFTLIMFFLHDMQAGPEIRWSVHAFGYAASIGLVVTLIYAIRGRLKKVEPQYRFSHESDWLFLGMLLLVTATGILQHVLHRFGEPMAANIAYVVHLSFVVPMLTLEVPFGKWSHMVYRPLAAYLDELRRDAMRAAAAPGQAADQSPAQAEQNAGA
ncbi:MAG: 4Fe-4S dicluster domain-containing protein [Polyangiaceae bacterium]|nr:4Fe-4S dicluster domain-containing protein [Polyangiaceae bacterium]